MMKKITKLFVLCSMVAVLSTGCENRPQEEEKLTEEIKETDMAENTDVTDTSDISETSDITDIAGSTDIGDTTDTNGAVTESGVDYDLTGMGSDMIYATVYQLMVNPDDYVGKTFKMKGLYYPSYYEGTGQYYHYCTIKDAAACCAQGIEFVWEDGNHVYPDEYPAENSEIIITGTFETYREENDPNLYCCLNQAMLEVVE